ncbi:hypothetical protein D9980_23500 [Serratia sp. 3ACOL1]|nr:hypothetical protein D9980_23500 [Serratia sp. 3ACOL1]
MHYFRIRLSVQESDTLEAHVQFNERHVETGFMVGTVRHRHSKEAATDMPDLQNCRATSRLYRLFSLVFPTETTAV